jgi:chorismate dehydratase
MSIPVAMIPYTNMAPYRQLGAPSGCHFVSLVPRKSIDALLAGTVVAAAVPVGGLARLGDAVETVGRFGIAAKGPCMSVLFFSRIPFEAMQAPRTLRITSETASSVRLLYLLMGNKFGFDRLPHLSPEGEKPDGELLIGDRALIRGQAMRSDDDYSHATDLSQKWLALTRLPFVFARWVVRKDAPDAVKTTISQWLETFKEEEMSLVDKATTPSAKALGLPEDVVRRYFRVIRRCFDEEEIQGQQRFFQEMEQLGRKPLFQTAPKTDKWIGRRP